MNSRLISEREFSSSGYLGLGFVKGVSVSRVVCLIVVSNRLTTAFKSRCRGKLEQTHPCPIPSSKKLKQSCCYSRFFYRKGDTMRPSLLGSRFYCMTVAMETKWGQGSLANSVLTGLELLIYIFGVKEKEHQVDASLDLTS